VPLSTGSPFITAAALQKKVFLPVKWAVPELIPEGLTIVAGKPKLGKSWLVLDIALAISQGGWTLGDRHCAEGEVLYCALEDGERRLQGRMQKVRGDAPWPLKLHFRTEMPSLTKGGLDVLSDWIAVAQNPRLILIDTFAKVRPGKERDETQYEADYRAAGILKTLADKAGVSVIMVHHVRKMEAEDPFDTVSGTNGLTGAADTILVLKRDGGGVTLYARGRDIEESELAVEFQRDICRWRVLGAASDVHRSDERRAVLEALRAASEPMTPRELSDVTEHAYGATRKLLFGMTRDGEVKRVGRGKYVLS
jgi:hypothetical protein